MEESSLKEQPFDKEPSLDDFDGDELGLSYYSPRQMPGSFSYSLDGKEYIKIGEDFDTTKLSDEYCKYGEFTGAFVGMLCVDRMFHRQQADFDFFCVEEKE